MSDSRSLAQERSFVDFVHGLLAPDWLPHWLARFVDDVLLYHAGIALGHGLGAWLHYLRSGNHPEDINPEDVRRAREVFYSLPHLFAVDARLPQGPHDRYPDPHNPAAILLTVFYRLPQEQRAGLVLEALGIARQERTITAEEEWDLTAWLWHSLGREEMVLGMVLGSEEPGSDAALGHAVKVLRGWRERGQEELAEHYQKLALGW